MRKSKVARVVLGLVTVAVLAVSMPACERLPTDVATDGGDRDSGCFLLHGVLHCPN
jgi:hypothetical protein